MALVIRPQHRSALSNVLDDCFQLRRRILVGKLGWELPGDDGVREMDQFDFGEAIHLVSLGPDGSVVGTARMTPSTVPNLTCDVLFRHLSEAPPRAPEIVESSRLCVDLDAPEEVRKAARADLYASHYELCLRQGWTSTIGFFYADFLANFVRAGFAVDYLGLPVRFKEGEPFSFPYRMTTDFEHAALMSEWMGPATLLDPMTEPGLISIFGDSKAA